MEYKYTVVDSIRSLPREVRACPSAAVLELHLRRFSTRVISGKHDSQLITPAVFPIGQRRRKSDIRELGGWLAFDVDRCSLGPEVQKRLAEDRHPLSEYLFWAYSTASSTPQNPKFRLVLPLASAISPSDYPHLWQEAARLLPDGAEVDDAAKDVGRLYYAPATMKAPGALNFFFSSGRARLLDPQRLLARARYRRLGGAKLAEQVPEKYRRALAGRRLASLTNTGYSWSSYRDCPFWPRALADEYRSRPAGSAEGWWVLFYTIMCGVAGRAVKKGYPITAAEVEQLMREFDRDTGGWYPKRPILAEAQTAIDFVLRGG